ncbi:dihydroxy-acid dehydratase, partial [Sarracenia purpurea var. burkii]
MGKSRDLIADSIETFVAAQWYEGNIFIPEYDKNMPGTIMAMGRLNLPNIMVCGETTKVKLGDSKTKNDWLKA